MIERMKFGTTKEGEDASIYILENSKGMQVRLSDFGALILTIMFPDKNGSGRDLALGFDEMKDYYNTDTGFGAYVGRHANRIKNASVTIEGIEYCLDKNDGENNLHSGFDRSHCKMYEAEYGESEEGYYVELSRTSPHLEQGFPGNLQQKIRYTLTEQNDLMIDYKMVSDKTTVVNPTNHTYFNLNGQNSGDVLRHDLEVYSDTFLEIDEEVIPTGALLKVDNTPMDFRKRRKIGEQIDSDYIQMKYANGYDHNYVFPHDGKMKKMVRLYSEESGISMTVFSDLCGLQVYSGNYLDGVVGKNGTRYGAKSGICFETQYYPNACKEEKFPSSILEAGVTFHSRTLYHFANCDEI